MAIQVAVKNLLIQTFFSFDGIRIFRIKRL